MADPGGGPEAGSGRNRARVAGGFLTFLVRVGGRGLALLSAIVIARALGVDGYGVYAYATAWVAVLMVPAVLGFDSLMLRQVAVYTARETPALIRGLINYAHRRILPLSLAIAAVAAVVAAVAVDETYLPAVLIALAIVPIRAMTAIRSGILQGLQRPELSFVPLFVVFPLAMIVLVGGAELAGAELDADLVVALAVVASAIGLAVAWGLTHLHLRPVIAGAEIKAERRVWRESLKSFTWVALITALASQIGLLLLGALGDPADVGVFQATMRIAEPVGIVFAVVTVATAPQLARFHELGDHESLRDTASHAARVGLAYSIPVAIAVLLAQDLLFGLFGEGFGPTGAALGLLVGSMIFNAFAGSVGNVLMMTGAARTVAIAKGAGLAIDIALCLLLIPDHGVLGAAIGRTADLVAWNAILAVVVWRRLGINATASPWPRSR